MNLLRSGKSCDIYDAGQDFILFKYTNRLSAFDKHVCEIPEKGKYIASINRWWMDRTKHIIKNHLICQDNEYILGLKCTPIPLEIIVRGYITGNTRTSLWTHYSAGERKYCDIDFPEGLVKNQKLPWNVVTPTTKNETHDEIISIKEILSKNIITYDELIYIYDKALQLFDYGTKISEEKGLILVDTKYEFGKLPNGEIILMDEIHTCDSSRFWKKETYEYRFANNEEPERFDKDIIRNKLAEGITENIVAEMQAAYKNFYDILLRPTPNLKYGCNPHQKAGIIGDNPYKVLNGSVGYINYLDAINAWALVSEVRESLNTVCVASFKHTSPAGVAIYGPYTDHLKHFYGEATSPTAIAFLRARDADPKSSFGDFIACSHEVDVETAQLIKGFVSDGIIAPSYEEEALDILKSKKNGSYIILQAPLSIKYNSIEARDIGGITMWQERNNFITRPENIVKDIVTNNSHISQERINDLVLANITTKYTQSNSVVCVYDGQTIGIGAGQQSRIDCVKLVENKAKMWTLRTSQRVELGQGLKRQEKINALCEYYENARSLEVNYPESVLSSDAFFPFRDNIDVAKRFGVKYIVQPGGSIADKNIIQACNEHDMFMCFTNVRIFHH